MMLLPVVNSGGKLIKLKFWLRYRQISMEKRARVPPRLAMAMATIFSVLPGSSAH